MRESSFFSFFYEWRRGMPKKEYSFKLSKSVETRAKKDEIAHDL